MEENRAVVNSNNTEQTFWVLIGSLSAFSFSIISSMILSRYLDKADYGTYKQIIYVYGTLLMVFTMGLPKAYSFFLPRVPIYEAKSLINKINIVLLALGGLMSLLIFFGSDIIANFLGNKDLGYLLKYFSLVPLFMLPTMGIEAVLSVFKRSKLIALYNVITRVLMLLFVTVPVLFFNGDVKDAVIGFTVSSFFCFIIALYLKYYPIKNVEAKKTSLKYKKIFDYTIPILVASIWGIIISSADQFFISRYFGNDVFAEFSNGSLELPFVGMIIAASSLVLAPIYSKKAFDNFKNTKKEILRLWHSVLSKTIMLIYPLVVFCFCFSDAIMVVLYGKAYEVSGSYFQIKLISNFFTLIAFWPLLLSIGGQKYYRNIHIYAAFLIVILEWLSVYFIKSPYAIIWISVLIKIGVIIAMLLYIATYLKVGLMDLFPKKLILKILIPSFTIVYTIKLSASNFIDFNNFFNLGFATLLFMFFYAIWAYFAKIDYYSVVLPLIKNFSNKKNE